MAQTALMFCTYAIIVIGCYTGELPPYHALNHIIDQLSDINDSVLLVELCRIYSFLYMQWQLHWSGQ
jgi:hypothetical protein